jgi:peptidyl-dipeptidase A
MKTSHHAAPRRSWTLPFALVLALALALGPAADRAAADPHETAADATYPATAEGARAFIDDAQQTLMALLVESGRAAWVQATYITEDTQALAATANEELTATTVRLAQEATRFDGLELPYDTARQLSALKQSLTLPAPSDPAKNAEVARLATSLDAAFGTGKFCRPDGECLTLDEMILTMAESRDPAELLDLWTGWRTVSPAMKGDFARLVELVNEGARELGYADLGTMWRSKYDMEPDAFSAELDRLWNQVRPLYEKLHCHVRARLAETYGEELVPPGKPIPAHLLGNMWAQTWSNVFPLVRPADAEPAFDLTQRLTAAGLDPEEMVRYGERFFTSLGFAPLPDTFWQRSMLVRPRDRDVVCHASAWDIDYEDDLRIKMCISINAEDFNTIHHELGHNFYQRAYKGQPLLYRESANDGFHEAVGDTIALSVTPKYLVEVGLLDAEPDASKDIGLLLNQALDKIAFLPFGLLIDQWRWRVFNGEIPPDQYNQAWWQLREKYQGIQAPVARPADAFDPGAKYHVPGNVPYTRYFLAHILQFQFHRALCEAAGNQGPLHRCSIYNNKAAGAKLNAMLEMGASRPWPEALAAVTGQTQMDATAILDYFAPLEAWLDEQNSGRQCGW